MKILFKFFDVDDSPVNILVVADENKFFFRDSDSILDVILAYWIENGQVYYDSLIRSVFYQMKKLNDNGLKTKDVLVFSNAIDWSVLPELLDVESDHIVYQEKYQGELYIDDREPIDLFQLDKHLPYYQKEVKDKGDEKIYSLLFGLVDYCVENNVKYRTLTKWHIKALGSLCLNRFGEEFICENSDDPYFNYPNRHIKYSFEKCWTAITRGGDFLGDRSFQPRKYTRSLSYNKSKENLNNLYYQIGLKIGKTGFLDMDDKKANKLFIYHSNKNGTGLDGLSQLGEFLESPDKVLKELTAHEEMELARWQTIITKENLED